MADVIIKLPVPLYHGTGTFFLQSIHETGLGARNLVKEWRIADMLRVAWEAFQELGGEDGGRSYYIPEMLSTWDQCSAAGDANWRQGGLYLTTSKDCARQYMGNAGPEMGREALSILEDLMVLDSRRADKILGRFPAIGEWACAPKVGVLIEVNALDLALLRSETGGAEHDFIEQLTENGVLTGTTRYSHEQTRMFEYLGTVRDFEVVEEVEFT